MDEAQIKEDVQFNFNLQKMKEAVEAPSHILPKGLTFIEFENWISLRQIISISV